MKNTSKRSFKKNLLQNLKRASSRISSFNTSIVKNLANKEKETFEQLFFLAGVCVGFFLNLTASIMYELIRHSIVLQIGVLIVSMVSIVGTVYLINKMYIKPYKALLEISKSTKNLEEEINHMVKETKEI